MARSILLLASVAVAGGRLFASHATSSRPEQQCSLVQQPQCDAVGALRDRHAVLNRLRMRHVTRLRGGDAEEKVDGDCIGIDLGTT